MEENKKDVLPLEGEPLTTPQISEPVVNALAAALNKIETYVPTQYINDGPPDIDAEHLNHAEQAIMRVTNLANGAADAISALQSQVTQLNNNLNPSTMITGGVIDYAESLPICFRTISVNERTSQTPSSLNYGTGYIEKSGETDIVIILHNVVTKETYTKRRSNIGWGDWETYALKSDMKVLKKTDVQFSDGFAEISFPGLTYDSAVCINQEYKSSAGVQNLVFTAQVRPNELIIYARNANDGSSYNGSIHIIAIAIG